MTWAIGTYFVGSGAPAVCAALIAETISSAVAVSGLPTAIAIFLRSAKADWTAVRMASDLASLVRPAAVAIAVELAVPDVLLPDVLVPLE